MQSGSIGGYRAACFLIVFLTGVLSAQADTGELNVHFRLLTLASIGEDLYYSQGGVMEKVEPRLNRLSRSYLFEVNDLRRQPLVFYRKVDHLALGSTSAAQQEVEPGYAPVGSIAFPSSGHYLLLISPVYDTQQGESRTVKNLRIGLIPDSLRGLSSNQWVLLNTTPHFVAARIGSDAAPLTISPGGRTITEINSDRQVELVQFGVRADENEDWKLFHSSSWPMFAETSYLILFVQLPGSDRIRIVRVVP